MPKIHSKILRTHTTSPPQLETTSERTFTCPFKTVVTPDSISFGKFKTFAFAAIDENNRKLESAINDCIEKEMTKKGLVLDPCIFPWYKVTMSRSDAAIRMCLLAWALQEDAYLDEAAGLLPAITDGRHLAARILLWRPKDGIRKQILLDCLHSQEENTRNVRLRW